MPDIRWFAPNAFCQLLVPELARRGLTLATAGDAPARVVLALSATVALPAWRHAQRHRCPLILYLWDLPPWRLGRGTPDPVWAVGGRLLRLPRLGWRYPERSGFYSRVSYIARRARAVWVPSEATRQAVLRHFEIEATRLPYCYDSHRFLPDTAISREPNTLLSVSRLEPYKNQAALLRAASGLRRRPRVRLIGDGSCRAELDALAKLHAVPCQIEGSVPDAEVVRAYRAAEVVVCPSRFEGFGLTPIEALASGAAVAASDIPAHREFLGEAVHYFDAGSDAALIAAIEAARTSPATGPSELPRLTIEAAAERFRVALATHL